MPGCWQVTQSGMRGGSWSEQTQKLDFRGKWLAHGTLASCPGWCHEVRIECGEEEVGRVSSD